MTIDFTTHPTSYKHWQLEIEEPLAYLTLNVKEDGGLSSGYSLKLNSYDLGVDIELADAIERLRFEHPEVKTVILQSGQEKIFCAGANIFMLGLSDHGFKVNFCKFTNETRNGMEDASLHSGIKFIASVKGPCAGGGYELALACDEIHLVDDGNSTVSLPEVPLLGVLPGTGGLTRVVDKRKVRRDRADFFSTVAEGIKGKRALKWNLVDAIHPRSQFDEAVKKRALELSNDSHRNAEDKGFNLKPVTPNFEKDCYHYQFLSVEISDRLATLTIKGPTEGPPDFPQEIDNDDFWIFSLFRELDHALLNLRFNHREVGTLILKSIGSLENALAFDGFLFIHQNHWLVKEMTHYFKRVLKRLDLTAKSILALIEPDSCFGGTLFELVLAADRSYMLDDMDRPNLISITAMNKGPYKMSNGLTRLETRFLGEPEYISKIELGHHFNPEEALEYGLVTFTPDDLDWEDEVRLAIEERTSFSPDALTGMEANLRMPGPETMETKIFGRLTAWQNWIFQRPNAVGENGALKLYGKSGKRPEFDWERT